MYMYSQINVELSCFDFAISRKSAGGLCHKMSAYMKKNITPMRLCPYSPRFTVLMRQTPNYSPDNNLQKRWKDFSL